MSHRGAEENAWADKFSASTSLGRGARGFVKHQSSLWRWFLRCDPRCSQETLVKLVVCVCESCSRVQLFVTLWTVAHWAPLSVGFPRQEYWTGLPCSSPGNLPDPGTEPGSPALQAESLQFESPKTL